jgi:hypothetical protein
MDRGSRCDTILEEAKDELDDDDDPDDDAEEDRD